MLSFTDDKPNMDFANMGFQLNNPVIFRILCLSQITPVAYIRLVPTEDNGSLLCTVLANLSDLAVNPFIFSPTLYSSSHF